MEEEREGKRRKKNEGQSGKEKKKCLRWMGSV